LPWMAKVAGPAGQGSNHARALKNAAEMFLLFELAQALSTAV
jgi:hypothetical protein